MKQYHIPIASFLCLITLTVVVIGLFFLPTSANSYLQTSASSTPTSQIILQTTLLPADLRQSNARFGSSVAVSAGMIVVGQPNAAVGLPNQGAAQVYAKNGSVWNQVAELTAPDAITDHYFGTAVAIDGSVMAVGAYGDDDRGAEAGSVYVYTRQGQSWQLETKLTAPDGAAGDRFGFSVAISGDTIIVGAPMRDGEGYNNLGMVYVFVQDGDNWMLQQKLLPFPIMNDQWFGYAVDIWGDQVVVGEPQIYGGKGRINIFSRSGNTWYFYQFEDWSNGAFPDGGGFGHSVSIYHDTLVVGVPGSIAADYDGVFYIYKWNGSRFDRVYVRTYGGHTGQSVDLYREISLFGAPYATDMPDIENNRGGLAIVVVPPDTLVLIGYGESTIEDGAQFGWSVARDGNDIVVGAPGDGSTSLAGEGAVYVYEINGPPWEAPSPTPVNFWPTATVFVASLTPEHIPSYTPTQYVSPTPSLTPTATNTPVTPTTSAGALPQRNFFTDRRPTLTWNPVTWAAGYEVEIDDAIDFRTLIDEKSDIAADTPFYQTRELADGTYYWRVRARRSNGTWGAWSAVEMFVVSAP
ncbi:MAG: hypothetical protein HZC41_08685 [Chloroflexi bacterium]|nr:hypothetical protein [Chloroflexota bacterium]